MLGKKLCKTDVRDKRYDACTDAGSPIVDERDEISPSAKYTVPKVARSTATRPVAYDWLLPDKHGARSQPAARP